MKHKDLKRSSRSVALEHPQPKRDRIGSIHWDERGNAISEQTEDPTIRTRAPIAGEHKASGPRIEPPSGRNPYETVSARGNPDDGAKPRIRRDLRKLSEWIKQMREMQQRKGSDEE